MDKIPIIPNLLVFSMMCRVYIQFSEPYKTKAIWDCESFQIKYFLRFILTYEWMNEWMNGPFPFPKKNNKLNFLF